MSGERQIFRELDRVIDGFVSAGDVGIGALGVAILRQAQKTVPRLTGKLAESAYVLPSRDGAGGFGYGVRYAIFVHEQTGRGRKWLQAAVMAFARRGLKVVAAPIVEAGKRGFSGTPSTSSEFGRSPQDAN